MKEQLGVRKFMQPDIGYRCLLDMSPNMIFTVRCAFTTKDYAVICVLA